MQLPFTILDVFTQTRYTGNPLAIVHLHPPNTLTQTQKQKIAQEFNQSETVFMHHPSTTSPSTTTSTSPSPETPISIFTPTAELPFAGHPTIGSAFHLLTPSAPTNANAITPPTALHTKAGRIPISLKQDGSVLATVPHEFHIHACCASATTHPLSSISSAVVSIVKGMTFTLTQLSSLSALESLTVASVSELGVEALDAEWRTGFHGRYFYVLLERDERIAEAELEPANGNAKPSHRHRVQARMISGVEDPATGSAACALAGYLALQQEFSYQGECVALEAGEELREAEWTERFEIVQGVEMGRRSEIGVEVLLAIEMGRQVVRRIRLRGQAVVVMMGSLEV